MSSSSPPAKASACVRACPRSCNRSAGGRLLSAWVARGPPPHPAGAAAGARLTRLTAELDDPAGYGRIVRNRRGTITSIVEEKDASATQRGIREVNTGIMALPAARLEGWLSNLTNRTAQ